MKRFDILAVTFPLLLCVIVDVYKLMKEDSATSFSWNDAVNDFYKLSSEMFRVKYKLDFAHFFKSHCMPFMKNVTSHSVHCKLLSLAKDAINCIQPKMSGAYHRMYFFNFPRCHDFFHVFKFTLMMFDLETNRFKELCVITELWNLDLLYSLTASDDKPASIGYVSNASGIVHKLSGWRIQ